MASNTVEEAIPQLDQENHGGFKSRPREPSHGAMQEPNSVQLRNFDSSNRPDAEGSTTDSTPSVPQNALNLQVSQPSNQVPRQDRTSRPVSPYRHSSRATSVAGQLSITSYTEADAAFVAKYVARRATLLGWFDAPNGTHPNDGWSRTCVAVKSSNAEYVFEPTEVNPALARAILRLNKYVALTMSSDLTSRIIQAISPQQEKVMVGNMHLPIITCLKDICPDLTHSTPACIVREENLVLLCSDDPAAIMNLGNDIEKELLDEVFGGPMSISNQTIPRSWSPRRDTSFSEKGVTFPPTPITPADTPVRGALDEKNDIYMKALALEEGNGEDDIDLEKELPPRPVARIHTLNVSTAIILVLVTEFLGISKLLNEYMWDGDPTRFALIAAVPLFMLLSLFFFIVIVGSIYRMFFPMGIALKNTKYHSAEKPKPSRHRNYQLPHITIQMPVYKEGLKAVIVPTIMSLMAAIQNYEAQGGTASVFVNDDGMQAVEPELAEARKQYYIENGIGYVARLPNKQSSPKKKKFNCNFSWSCFRKSKKGAVSADKVTEPPRISECQVLANEIGFERKGKFKKASNMNYGLSFSNRVEDELQRLTQIQIEKSGNTEDLTVDEDNELYQQALNNMLAEDAGRTWAAGNIRLGELILLVDCDTRVPQDCLLYGALEMHESPEVAILQHSSGVMKVVNSMFENGIAYFTDIVYTAIQCGVGCGDVAPFVGHNAFIRWKALQSVAFVDPVDNQTKWWSDTHVSEDFDVSLRLQMEGMVIRLASYHNGGFKEGVSLTLYDELARWEKYAYGCSELVFHPLYQWPYRGPLTRLFLRFLWSNIAITSKVLIVAYICTYYAIACGLLLPTVSYIAVGLFIQDIDHYYESSWSNMISLLVVFNGVNLLATSMLRHQMKETTFWKALFQAIKWLPFLIFFFGGISVNCAKALLCHLFSINIEWTSTAKEIGPRGFYISLDKMAKTFKYTWVICIILATMMLYFCFGAPWGWTISPTTGGSTFYMAIVPIAIQTGLSFLLPFVLGLN